MGAKPQLGHGGEGWPGGGKGWFVRLPTTEVSLGVFSRLPSDHVGFGSCLAWSGTGPYTLVGSRLVDLL